MRYKNSSLFFVLIKNNLYICGVKLNIIYKYEDKIYFKKCG